MSPLPLPSGQDALDLPVDRLALRLLAHLRDMAASGRTIQRGLVVGREILGDRAEGVNLITYEQAMQEAWDWLRNQGLISGAVPGQMGQDWAFITRLGNEVAQHPARLAAQRRLDVDLHPRIADRIRQQFVLGEYELAAFAALREVEIRVRELSGASNSEIGIKLMGDSFKSGARLHDPSLDKGESEAIVALFRGAIGVFKNPSSHRQVDFDDPTEASEVILLADLLLRMLNRIALRIDQQPR